MTEAAASHAPTRRAAARPRRARPGTLAIALLAALALGVGATVELLRHRVALEVLVGRATLALLVLAQLAGAVCVLLALVRTARGGPDATPVTPRLLGYLLVLGALVHVVAAPSYRSLYAHALFGACAGLFGLLVLAAPRLRTRLASRTWSLLDLLAACACVLLVGGELALRALASLRPSPILARGSDESAATIDEHRLDPGSARPGFPVNAGGHHDGPFDARAARRPLVVTIGDSFSTGIVPHAYHFTTVAEGLMPAGEVYNMGVAAIGLREYLRLLRTEALPLRPDLVVANVFIGNDLVGTLRDPPPTGWLQAWTDREHLLIALVPARLVTLARERPADARAPGAGAARGADVPLTEQFPWLEDALLEVPSFSPGTFTRLERLRAAGVCDPRAPPDWDGVLATLDAMRRACGEVPFAVMMIPDEFQVEDAVWEDVVADPALAHLDRDAPQRRLGTELDARGVPYLDLLPVLRAQAPLADGRRHVYHLRESHFNARGNAAAGRALAAFIASLLP